MLSVIITTRQADRHSSSVHRTDAVLTVQVLDGGCNDSFTISDESINRAKRNPPVSVEERSGWTI